MSNRRVLPALLMLTSSLFASSNLQTTTTLAQETANNTSAAATFKGQVNGNAKPGNVSKLSIRSLFSSAFNGKILAHYMPWFGSRSHVSVGYSSHDPVQAEKTVVDMISRGYDGMVVSETNSNAWDIAGTQRIFAAVNNHPGFYFAVMENKAALSKGPNPTTALLADMAFDEQHYFNSPNYLRVNGRPVVFFFDRTSGLDWTKAKAKAAGNPIFIFRNAGGFSDTATDGAYSWIGSSSASDPSGVNYLKSFYSTAGSAKGKIAVGSAWKGFNDSIASWSKHRVVPQDCGRTLLRAVRAADAIASGSDPLDFVQMTTWNDYEEGTEMESGIDNCASMVASVQAGVLSFGPRFTSSQGTEQTVDHYQVFISADGQNLKPLVEMAPGMRTLNLNSYSLSPGAYYVHVQMVGKPGILNRMSPAARYTRN